MEFETKLYETSRYRCLEYPQKQSEDLYLTLCGIEHCLPGYEFHTAGRPGFHLHVILSGKGELSVNGRLIPLHFGQMFITKPGEETWYRADTEDPWSYCWMTYDGNQALRYTESAGFVKGVNWLNCHVDEAQFYRLVKRILDQPELTLANDLLRFGLLLEFLSLAMESDYQNASTPRREIEYSADVYVEYAINYLQANYATAKINDVAAYIGIHRSYLTGIFKKKMGISPQEYLMQCRMKNACSLLLETDFSIQDISQRVGYDNSLTFSKVFKSYYGISPKHFREKKSGKNSNSDEEHKQ